MRPRAFISYRRADTSADARGLRDFLAGAFGAENVFMDIDNLLPGQRFDRELKKALRQCNVLLAIIGGRWLSLLNERRQSRQEDFMRKEIAAALARGKLVIPVLIDDAAIPSASVLPRDIRPLAYHQTLYVKRASFARDLERLGNALREQLPRHHDAQEDRWRRHRFGLGALTLAAGLAVAVAWYSTSPLNGPKEVAAPGSSAVAGACAKTVTFACLRAGLVRGHVDSDLRQTECTEERTYLPAELGWRSIWTTSVYSYAPGDSGPGGGLEN
ncbi:MAG: toll/interleukin-1 receptor domain-containing protein, partial [Hyphomicrobiaceae bacterium]